MTDATEVDAIQEPAVLGEAAADSAAPADIRATAARRPVTFDEMVDWIYERAETREGTMNAFYPVGSAQRAACEREIRVMRKILDGVVFMRDHEEQLRAYVSQLGTGRRKARA